MRSVIALVLMVVGLVGLVVSASVLAGPWAVAGVASALALVVGYLAGDA